MSAATAPGMPPVPPAPPALVAPTAPARPKAVLPSIVALLSRGVLADRATAALPIVAFAIVTALVLVVLGGVLMFFRSTADTAFVYQLLSVLALALLVVPLLSLGGAAARLSARRRDDRLASLRLLGATSGLVTRLSVLEATSYAVVGVLLGAGGYAVLMPVVGLIPFGGAPVGASALWVGVPALGATLVGVCAIAALSAAAGMRGVVVDPLGVRAKQRAPRVHWLRLVVGAAVVAVASAVTGAIGGATLAVMLVALGGAFAASVGILNLVGPFVIAVAARISARRARSVEALVAARLVLESPTSIWRQVGGAAMTTFVAVVAGSGLALLGTAQVDASVDPAGAILVDDIRTGVLLTLAISFVMVACSVGINQAAAALDRRDLTVALDRMGVPRRTMERARRMSVLRPLGVVTVTSALAGVAVVLPIAGIALVLAPLSMAVVAGSIALGVAIVTLALVATRPVVSAVLASPERA